MSHHSKSKEHTICCIKIHLQMHLISIYEKDVRTSSWRWRWNVRRDWPYDRPNTASTKEIFGDMCGLEDFFSQRSPDVFPGKMTTTKVAVTTYFSQNVLENYTISHILRATRCKSWHLTHITKTLSYTYSVDIRMWREILIWKLSKANFAPSSSHNLFLIAIFTMVRRNSLEITPYSVLYRMMGTASQSIKGLRLIGRCGGVGKRR